MTIETMLIGNQKNEKKAFILLYHKMNTIEKVIPKLAANKLAPTAMPPRSEMDKYYLYNGVWTRKPAMTEHNRMRDCFLQAAKDYIGTASSKPGDQFDFIIKRCVRTPTDMRRLRMAMT
jgi:hypothetical protein